MKKLIYRAFIVMLLSLLPAFCFGQAVYEGQLINADTEEGLMDATVTLLKSKQATASNYQGYFRLIADYTITNDTIVVTHVGFKAFRLPVTGYQPNIFIKLEPTIGQLAEVTVGATKAKKRLSKTLTMLT
ncbi:carboxypeptidase-like regulatory domain-containing protein [Mucilaginibacter antarcticus]|uniref:carboxypeptidase-like regulatory domain-containing protein n=1 Tax=Mucilaginibacter antarcticus TaxID=1855725 RepID=UPI0036415095